VIDLPPVVGDPGAIRAFAGYLRSIASQLEGYQADVASTPRSMTFEGPAAEAFAGKMQALAGRVGTVADELRAVASRVDAAAEEVARRIEARQRLLEELARSRAAAGSTS
jgi:uncharacterized protein YukE